MSDLIQFQGGGHEQHEANALSVMSASDFFPRLQLIQPASKAIGRKQVKSAGVYSLTKGKDEVEDLGDTVNIVVCAVRAKALRTKGMLMSIFDPKDDEFAKIKNESRVKNSGCMWGPEFLLYLPDYDGGEGLFATFFMSSPTQRRSSKSVNARIRNKATLTSKFIEDEEHGWYATECNDCVEAFANMPSAEDFAEQIKKFNDEQPTKAKTVADAGTEGGRER